jgi:hypothetical protein
MVYRLPLYTIILYGDRVCARDRSKYPAKTVLAGMPVKSQNGCGVLRIARPGAMI